MSLITRARRSHIKALRRWNPTKIPNCLIWWRADGLHTKIQRHRLELPPLPDCLKVLAGVLKMILIVGSIVLFYFIACTIFDDLLRGLL